MDNLRFIYIIQAQGTHFYKIGVAKNPSERLQILQIGCPLQLILVKTIPDYNAFVTENYIHATLAGKHTIGEWFELNEDDLTFLDNPIPSNEPIYCFTAPSLNPTALEYELATAYSKVMALVEAHNTQRRINAMDSVVRIKRIHAIAALSQCR